MNARVTLRCDRIQHLVQLEEAKIPHLPLAYCHRLPNIELYASKI